MWVTGSVIARRSQWEGSANSRMRYARDLIAGHSTAHPENCVILDFAQVRE